MGWQPGPMTHRQFLAWTEWLKMEWNHPSRTDCYLMQATAEIRRVLHKHPNRVQLKHFLLKFDDPKKTPKETPESIERAQALSMAKWLGAMGGSSSIRVIHAPEDYDPHEEFDVQPYIVDMSKDEDDLENQEEGEE